MLNIFLRHLKILIVFVLVALLWITICESQVGIAQTITAEDNIDKSILNKNLNLKKNYYGSYVDIEIIPGTIETTNSLKKAIVDALRTGNIEKNIYYFAITDIRLVEDWALVSVIGFINNYGSSWFLEDGAWFGIILLRDLGNSHWNGAVQGTDEFTILLNSVPNEFLDNTAKVNLQKETAQNYEITQEGLYTFPWQAGSMMFYGSNGVHNNGFSSVVNDWKAVDMLSDGNTSIGHAPNRLLASETSTINYKCYDGVSVAVRMGNFFYTHLINNSNLFVGKTFNQREDIGQMKPGTFSGNCGYTNQSDNWFHVHWGFPNSDLYVDGWTLSISSQNWTNGSTVVSPGGGWIISSSNNCNNPSPNNDQIGLYADDNYCGAYKLLGVGDYPNPGALGVSNDSISSIKVGSNVKATLCRDDNYNGGCEDFTSDDSHLGNNSIGNDSVSSAKVTWRSSGNTLPSDYGYCAEEGQRCSFSGTAQIYYGANNQYVGPRTYTDGVDCNNTVFGDPIPGVHKQCFIKGGRPQGSTWCANENGTCSFGSGNVATVYYGANGKYNIKTGVISSIACNNSTFGDPFVGIGKACYYIITGSSISTPSNPSPSDNTTLPRTNNTVLSWSTNGTNCTIHIWGGSINISPANNCGALTLGQQRGGAYNWQVTASNSSGSATGPVWHFNIKPYPPTNLLISNYSATQVSLSWTLSSDEPSDVDEYYIYQNDQYVGSVSKGTSTYTVNGLSCSGSYSFYVKSRRQGVLSDASNTVYRGSVGCPPSMPTNLRVSNSTINSITLSWQDNSNNENGFKIYRWGYEGNAWGFYYLDSVGPNVTSYTQTNLSCGNDFNFYEVSAFNQYGESAHAGWVQGITAPCPPAELQVRDITFDPPSAYSNDNVYAYVSIENQSNQSISSFWTDLYIDDQPSGCNDWGSYYFWVDEIGANSIDTWVVKISADTLTPGIHQVRVFVDSGCNVTEGDENNNIGGPYQLQLLNPPAPPINDEIEYAKNITPVHLVNLGIKNIYEDNLDVTGAHISPNDPYIPICNLEPGLSSVWYKYIPLMNETVKLSTIGSNFDTYIAAWSGSISNLELVGCNDDYDFDNGILQSELSLHLLGGATYYFEIAEWNGYFNYWAGIPSLSTERQPPIKPKPGDNLTISNVESMKTKNYKIPSGITVQSSMAGKWLVFQLSYPRVYLPIIIKK